MPAPLGESLEERFPQTPFRPFYAAKTSVLAEFFWDGSPLPRLGAASGKWASPGPSPVVGRKPNNPLGAPGTGIGSPGGSRFSYCWFAPGLAEGVSRGGNYLPRTCAPLRGWQRALARPKACRVGEVFFLAATPSCAGGCGPLPAAGGRGPWPAGAPGTGTGSPGGGRLLCRWFAFRLAGRRVAWNTLPSPHPRTLARVAAGPCPPHLVENFVETVERTKNARLFLN